LFLHRLKAWEGFAIPSRDVETQRNFMNAGWEEVRTLDEMHSAQLRKETGRQKKHQEATESPKASEAPRDATETKEASVVQDEVGQWLADLGLERYAAAFAREEVTLEVVHLLDEQDLKDLGVDKLGPRKKILEAVRLRRGAAG